VADIKIRSHLTGFADRLKAAADHSVLTVVGRPIITRGVKRNFWADIYYNAMIASWPVFFGSAFLVFALSNFLFALVLDFGADPVSDAHGLADLFFFSVETTTTVGYGDMHPQTYYGHAIAATEGFMGLFVTASLTGLVFARLSLPRARVLFARNPVVMRRNGLPTLVFRIANARGNFITEASVKLWALMGVKDSEGRTYVGFQPLKLLKNENPAFVLSWTLFHPIDQESPLFGMSPDEIRDQGVNFVVSLTGLDETSAQAVHARETFAASDLRFDHEFVDMHTIGDDGVRRVDYRRIHDTRPIPGPKT
jgi:inward rectifier potassium channel